MLFSDRNKNNNISVNIGGININTVNKIKFLVVIDEYFSWKPHSSSIKKK